MSSSSVASDPALYVRQKECCRRCPQQEKVHPTLHQSCRIATARASPHSSKELSVGQNFSPHQTDGLPRSPGHLKKSAASRACRCSSVRVDSKLHCHTFDSLAGALPKVTALLWANEKPTMWRHSVVLHVMSRESSSRRGRESHEGDLGETSQFTPLQCSYCASVFASESARLAVSEWGSESVPLIDQATR